MILFTPKVGAKNKLLFSKPAFGLFQALSSIC